MSAQNGLWLALFFCLIIGSCSTDPVPKPKLKGVTVASPPFTFKNANGTLSGFAVDLINLIAQKANFDYELSLQPDGQYGIILPNGTVTGMIGELFNKKADFAIADLTVTEPRKAYVQFSEPMLSTALAALIRRDIATENGFIKLEDIIAYNEREARANKSDNQIVFGAVGHGATIRKLATSAEPAAQHIYSSVESMNGRLKSRPSGVERVASGRFAMVLEASFADYAAAQNCSLVSLYDASKRIFQRDQSMALQKESPYGETINRALKHLKQDGTVERLRAKYWQNMCTVD